MYDDDTDIIVIQHQHGDTYGDAWGCSQPVWVNEDELMELESYRKSLDNNGESND